MVVCTHPGNAFAQSKTSALFGSTDGTGENGLVFDGRIVVPASTMLTTGRRPAGAAASGATVVGVGVGAATGIVDVVVVSPGPTFPRRRRGNVPDTTCATQSTPGRYKRTADRAMGGAGSQSSDGSPVSDLSVNAFQIAAGNVPP